MSNVRPSLAPIALPDSSPLKLPTKVQEAPAQNVSKFDQCRNKLDTLMQAPPYELFMTLITFLVLYADDVRMLALSKEDDYGYYIFMLICFFIFATEIVVLTIVRPGYAFGFFFWMDIASTLSTVMEIPLVMSDLLGIDAFSSSKSTKLAKAGRASRVSSRATKIIRVVRLIRLVRIAKLYRYAYKGIESKLSVMQAHEKDENGKKNDEALEKLPVSNNDLDQEDKDVLQYNQKMIPKPRMMPTVQMAETNRGPRPQHMQMDTERNPIITPAQHSTIRIEMTQNNNEGRSSNQTAPDHKSMRAQLIEIGEKPIHYEEQHSMDSNEDEIQVYNQGAQEQLLIEKGGEGMHAELETKVGKLLSDLTTRRAIMVMFSIMISIPLLQYDTYFTDVSAFDTGLIYLEETFNSQEKKIHDGYAIGTKTYQAIATDVDSSTILFLKVDQHTIIDNLERVSKLRDEEMRSYVSNSGVAAVLIDNKDTSNLDAILGIIRTSFVIVVLVSGAIFFSKDSNDLVVTPIESMLAKVRRISKNPLEAAHIEEDMAIAEDQLKKQNLEDKLIREKLQQKGFETVVLEKLIVKTGALLAIGFGEAGSEIIAQNMNQDGDVNPMIPGKKIFAIFGFCDIRNFIDMTEVLEERVMVFVNEVADIVHNTVNAFEGSANKNIGDAFLLVWKFPGDTLRLNKDYPEILNLRLVNNLADMALLSFIKIFISVRKSKNIDTYYKLPEVQAKLPNFKIKMGFGLHVGWAIEGAIGSMFKIDASYLSPNVNMASRLEAATKQYGVFHLVSGPFYRLLSNIAQSKMRHLDRVTVKGSIQPVDFFTFDVDLDVIEGGSETRQIIKNKKIMRYFDRRRRIKRMENIRKEKFDINSTFENDEDVKGVQEKFTELFYSTFHDGVNSYLQGRWAYAKSCFEKTKVMLSTPDGPSTTLLNYMSTFDFDAPEEWKGYRELTDK